MSILPTNETKKTVDVPMNFFIYGATMSGKSYLAEHFPAPLFLNTDGNAKANPFPNIQLKNVKGSDGKLVKSVLTDLDDIMKELQALNDRKEFQYKTIIIDVIDDVCQLIEQAICIEHNVKALADIAYGKGYATFNAVLNTLVLDLKSLGLNVVYISRVETVTESNDNSRQMEIPSLKTKYYNIVNGNCDLVIHTQKIGKKYLKSVTDIRKKYYVEDMNNKHVAKLLSEIPGALYRKQSAITEKQQQQADKMVKQRNEQVEQAKAKLNNK